SYHGPGWQNMGLAPEAGSGLAEPRIGKNGRASGLAESENLSVRPSLTIRVERRLHELGITAATATRRGRLSRTLIYDIPDGSKTNVRSDNAIKLAEALDCDVGSVIGTQDEPRVALDAGSATEARLVRVYGDVASGIWNESAPYGLYHPDQPHEWDVHP